MKMINNSKISSKINRWKIEFDQNDFVSNEDWLVNADETEDILQLSHIDENGPILDVGFYGGNYKIFVIYDKDWESPIEVFESNKIENVTNRLYELIDKYANR